MPRYRVTGVVAVSVTTVVEAPTPAAAKKLALDRAVEQSLCHQCANLASDTGWVSTGEFDGDVMDVVDATEIKAPQVARRRKAAS